MQIDIGTNVGDEHLRIDTREAMTHGFTNAYASCIEVVMKPGDSRKSRNMLRGEVFPLP